MRAIRLAFRFLGTALVSTAMGLMLGWLLGGGGAMLCGFFAYMLERAHHPYGAQAVSIVGLGWSVFAFFYSFWLGARETGKRPRAWCGRWASPAGYAAFLAFVLVRVLPFYRIAREFERTHPAIVALVACIALLPLLAAFFGGDAGDRLREEREREERAVHDRVEHAIAEGNAFPDAAERYRPVGAAPSRNESRES